MKKLSTEIQSIKHKNGEKRHLKAAKRKKSKKFKSKPKSNINLSRSTNKRDKIYPGIPIVYPVNIGYLVKKEESFSNKSFNIGKKSVETLELPPIFSFLDNYEASFNFLKKLLIVLEAGVASTIYLNYYKCKRIDVDASICMDIILGEYFVLKQEYSRRGKTRNPIKVVPINHNDSDISKVLHSIGAFRNLLDFKKDFKDVIALPVLMNSQDRYNKGELSEIQQTQIIDHIKKCLQKMGLSLTSQAITEFYQVIGEIMSNADEHSTLPHRYAIGYFKETNHKNDHFGFYNFSIFNFGETIYEKFASDDCKNQKVKDQMKSLSEEFTTKGFLRPALFEEESLWTLYALQEGVTSTLDHRGNGSIGYMKNFFQLKGDLDKDNQSKLVLISGHTRIVFDGTYPIIQRSKVNKPGHYNIITFNKQENLHAPPDEKYVTFTENYFPGTIISARILLKDSNIKNLENGD